MKRTNSTWIMLVMTTVIVACACQTVIADPPQIPSLACSAQSPTNSPDAPLVGDKQVVGDKQDLAHLADSAVSENSDAAQAAIEKLRQAGPAGLEALRSAHETDINQHIQERTTRSTDPAWQRLMAAMDAVGGQHDCQASHLYWYTDFDAAKAAAKESGKPILSLRLLGKLTDEFSCANSRFFRSTLYTNDEIGRELREHFILHWQSVRPVPKVTIDFGDGRKLERTLTGNSIHYILDSDGRMIDALPGLYGPQAFLRGLQQAQEVFAGKSTANVTMNDTQWIEKLKAYHAAKSSEILAAWQADIRQLGLADSATAQPAAITLSSSSLPSAAAPNRLSISKGAVETKVLTAALPDAAALAAKTDDAVWGRIAQLHQGDAELDAASRAFIQSQNPTAGRAMPLTASKARVESPMLRLINNLQNNIAIDTVRNEYTFHRQIHDWFASGEVPPTIDVNQLNDRVYAQLFLTPSSDPWLGLLPGDVYTALDDAGVTQK